MKSRMIHTHYSRMASLPLRECGLKFDSPGMLAKGNIVTPLAGVWIEITLYKQLHLQIIVTPLAGVWIEIIADAARTATPRGHSPCGSVD